MAARIDEARYSAMISALATFANQISNAVDKMQSYASACTQAIGDEDNAVGPICTKIRESEKKYLLAAKEAVNIAQEMQKELDEQKKEDAIWDSDDGGEE